jgi:hypothetical protein
MATQTSRIGVIFAKIQETTTEVQQTVVRAMSYWADGQGTKNHSLTVETTEEALVKTVALFEQLRALRSALGKVKAMEAQGGSAG